MYTHSYIVSTSYTYYSTRTSFIKIKKHSFSSTLININGGNTATNAIADACIKCLYIKFKLKIIARNTSGSTMCATDRIE